MANVLHKKMILVALGAAVAMGGSMAQAHGSTKPKHGGVVQIVGETSFELVGTSKGVELYLLEEGDEIASSGVSAKLTVVERNGGTSETLMKPARANKLEAPGLKLTKGSKATVLLTDTATQAKTNAVFTIN